MTERRTLCALMAVALVLSLPPLLLGLPTSTSASGHDVTPGIRWLGSFATQFWQGDLYPRWLTANNNGLGEPVFYFYPPLAYFLAAPLRGPDPGWLWADTAMALVLAAGRIAAAVGCFVWLRRHTGIFAAAFGTVFYIACPYTLAIDVYVRTVFAETMALAVLPFVFIGLDDTLAARRGGAVWFAVAVAVLALCHLPTLLLAAVLGGIYGCILAWRQPERLLIAGLAGAVGIGIAGIHVVPALALQDLISMQAMFTADFSPPRWFLDAEPFRRTRLHLLLYVLWQLALSILALTALWWLGGRRMPQGRCRAALVASLIGLWLLTSLSGPVWFVLPMLAKVQFPWRIMGELSLLTSLLLAYAANALPPARVAMIAVPLLGLGLGPTAWSLIDDKFLHGAALLRSVARDKNLIEYVTATWTGPLDGGRLAIQAPAFALDPPTAGTIEAASWNGGGARIRLSTTAPANLIVPQQFFPAWSARDAAGNALEVGVAPPLGLLRVAVPAMTGEIRVERRMLPSEWAGIATSSAGLAIVLAMAAATFRRRRVA